MMKKTIHKLLALTLAFLMVAALTACGGGGGDAPSPAPSGGQAVVADLPGLGQSAHDVALAVRLDQVLPDLGHDSGLRGADTLGLRLQGDAVEPPL